MVSRMRIQSPEGKRTWEEKCGQERMAILERQSRFF